MVICAMGAYYRYMNNNYVTEDVLVKALDKFADRIDKKFDFAEKKAEQTVLDIGDMFERVFEEFIDLKDTLNSRMDGLDSRIDGLDSRMANLEAITTEQSRQLNSILKRLDSIDDNLETASNDILAIYQMLSDLIKSGKKTDKKLTIAYKIIDEMTKYINKMSLDTGYKVQLQVTSL
jgi:chromosome segregation ATPase